MSKGSAVDTAAVPHAVPDTIRVFITGDSGSGKTTRAYSMFLSKFPRVIYLDVTGEWIDRADITAYGVAQGIDAIRNAARESGKWSVAIALDSTDDAPAFIDWLLPVPDLTRSPVLALGGAAVLVDEVDLLAPPRTSSREVRTLYRRSRHIGLSVISTTQRPANVSREVSAMSTHVIVHRLREPADRDYVADLLRWDQRAVARWMWWTQHHQHGAALVNLRNGALYWLPDSGAPVRDRAGALAENRPRPGSAPQHTTPRLPESTEPQSPQTGEVEE